MLDKIGTEERAALINLYSTYEYEQVDFADHQIESYEIRDTLNKRGQLGFQLKVYEPCDGGAMVLLERKVFNRELALARINEQK